MTRKGENIYKRKDGRWEGRYIKFYDLNKTAHYGYIYAKTYSEAKLKLSDIKSASVIKTRPSSNGKTIDAVSRMWLDEMQITVKKSTAAKYANIVNNHISPMIGKNKIGLLNTQLIKKLVDEKLTDGKLDGSGGLSAKTVRDILSVLKLIILYAESIGINCYCNFDSIVVKAREKNITALNINEQNTLTSYLINNIDNSKLGVLICLYTGLRIGEICALKFEDISISDGILSVKKTMQRIQNFYPSEDGKTSIFISEPKSRCSIRDIPLPKFIIDIMQSERIYCPKAYLLTGDSNIYVEPRTLQNRFKAYTHACGIDNVNFHILRHTFATRCVETGFEIKSLSEILGHSNVNITLNRYVHSSIELKRNNMKLIENLVCYSPSNM